jgi:thiamine pyrophosphate-dependent acetolactate synthase large subunit-like protein
MVTAKDIEAARLARVAAMDTPQEADKLAALKALIADAKREWWEERAAIRQYDGGQSIEDAEAGALHDVGGES